MSRDPTRTITLRAAAYRQIRARFGLISASARKAVLTTNILAPNPIADISVNALTVDPFEPLDYTFIRSDQRVELFDSWLKAQVDTVILETEKPKSRLWLNTSVGGAYDRGARKVRTAAYRAIPQIRDLDNFNPLTHPKHLERAELIYSRVFNGMEGLTDTMKSQMSRVLAEGILQGESPKVVAEKLAERVNVGISRARLIARTEIIEAHNEAAIQEAANVEAESGVTTLMEWIANLDERVRDTHRARHKKIMKRSKALQLIGEPNCRCSVVPVFAI